LTGKGATCYNFLIIRGGTYGTKRQVVTAGSLELELEEVDAITLSNAMPMYDEVGMIQDVFNFRLKNTGTASVQYIVKLVDITDSSKEKLDTSIVKYGLTKDEENTIQYLSNIVNGRIDKGVIDRNQTIEYSLRLWIDSKVTDNSQISGKSLSYRIDVEASQEKPYAEMQKRNSTEAFWKYKDNIMSIVFENSIQIPDTVEEDKKWDISVDQNGDVMAYVEPVYKGSTIYELHIQGKDGITANADSSLLFSRFLNLRTIEGLEYFDTSNVTNMASMFSSCRSLTSIDLSNFNTSKVTNMSYMFSGCSSLTNLDLSHFDTSNVDNMLAMFRNCSSLISLDLSSFDTSNVTNMTNMFLSVKNDCLITVRDDAMKTWVLEQNSKLTNIVVKSV